MFRAYYAHLQGDKLYNYSLWYRHCRTVGRLRADCSPLSTGILYGRLYRVSQVEWTKLRESVTYVELYRYNPNHLYPKLNGYGDNGQRSLKF